LNLGLFIHAQHQCALRRVQVQARDVGQLGVELRGAAELEGFDPMRLQTVFLPDPVHRGGRQPHFFNGANTYELFLRSKSISVRSMRAGVVQQFELPKGQFKTEGKRCDKQVPEM
jgi:hypothetical protein